MRISSDRRQHFSASYDATTKIISTAACAMLLVAAITAHNAIVGSCAVLLILVAYAYSPRGYILSERSIIVKRLIGNVHIRLEDIRQARIATTDDLRSCIRLWGSGGMFGSYGLYRTSRLGKCWWYVTNRRNAVVVITAARTAVFSPDDQDGFLAAIREAAPIPETAADPSGRTPERYNSRNRIGLWTGSAVAGVVVAVVAFALLYSPGPPDYTLTPATLTIHDRFYPATLSADKVDIANIRVVDIRTDEEWRPAMRTKGFANSHYRSGWFRVASGKKVLMYRADGKRLVLVPPKGDGLPVLLEVKDPEQFVQEVRRVWNMCGA